jgi:hypothetical protein
MARLVERGLRRSVGVPGLFATGNADLIYLDAVHAPRSEQLLGPTTTYVLAKRPCRIVVETGAATLADRAAGAGYPGPGGRTRDPHTTSTG